MKFLAFLRKELRDAAPFLILAVLTMLLIGGGLWRFEIREASHRRSYWRGYPGRNRSLYYFARASELRDCAPLILLAAGGLGLLLAGRQFLVPALLKTWSFTLHRSLSPVSILLAKFATAAICLCLGVGAIWTGLFLQAMRPGALAFPPRLQVLAEGWMMVAMGMIVYLGAALSAISPARWYTTRIFGLALAVGIVSLALVQGGLVWSGAVMLVGLAVLVPQLLHAFLNREF